MEDLKFTYRTSGMGYATTGMGEVRGFSKEHICVINHKGSHDDMLAIVERKTRNFLFK